MLTISCNVEIPASLERMIVFDHSSAMSRSYVIPGEVVGHAPSVSVYRGRCFGSRVLVLVPEFLFGSRVLVLVPEFLFSSCSLCRATECSSEGPKVIG